TTEEHRGLVLAGQVMRNDGKLLRARELLTSCRDASCDDAAAECEEIRRYCTAKLAETIAAIPSIAVDVRDDRGLPVRAMLRVDAALAENQSALDLDPGHHVVRASYAGVTGSAEITLESGQKHVRVPIVLDLRRSVRSRPTP